MKFNFSLALILWVAALSSTSHAINPDGCFQMYLPGSMYPVICVEGSAEGASSGDGIKVSTVGPNSLTVRSCSKASSMDLEGELTQNKSTFWFQSGDFVRFNGALNPKTKQEEGTVSMGNSTFNYFRLQNQETEMVLDAVMKSGKCTQ